MVTDLPDEGGILHQTGVLRLSRELANPGREELMVRSRVLRLLVSALMLSTTMAVLTMTEAPKANAATTVFVDRRSVVPETYDTPMKVGANSSTDISMLNALVDGWIAKQSHLKYGPTENPFKMNSRPVADSSGLYEIDCSSFVQAVLEGLWYNTTLYNPLVTRNYSTLGTTMPFYTLTDPNFRINRRMLADMLAQWAYDHGYWFAARPDYTNIQLGDALFWHAYPEKDALGNPVWKQVSHVAFVTKLLPDNYFEIAEATEVTQSSPQLISRRVLHATDLHRYQVYSGARFPLRQMWSWDNSASQDAINQGWTFSETSGKWTYLTSAMTSYTNGWQTIAGKQYYFDSNGFALFGQQTIGGVSYLIDQNQGAVPDSTWAQIQANQDKYFGDSSGIFDHYTAATRGWQKIDGAWYYFLPTTGYMVRDGWQWIYEPALKASSWNYCRHNGQCIDQLYTEKGMTFMALAGPQDYARGWYTVDGFTRYFRTTSAASMATGFQKIDGTWYFLRPTSGTKAYGWQFVGSTWHYLDPTTGALTLDGTFYIIDSYDVITWDSTNGYYSAQKFITASDGQTYLTRPGPDKYATGYQNLSGNWYYFDPDGAMVRGWYFSDGTWHYYRSSGTSALGRQNIDGVWYDFASYNVGVTTR
jgi:glucan-binding YG repeat protein